MIPIQNLIQLASKALGRDLSVEANLFFRARAAIGGALTPQGQEFFVKNWPAAVDFMESPAGQQAIADFMNAWAQSLVPASLSKPKVELPPPAPAPAAAPLPAPAEM